MRSLKELQADRTPAKASGAGCGGKPPHLRMPVEGEPDDRLELIDYLDAHHLPDVHSLLELVSITEPTGADPLHAAMRGLADWTSDLRRLRRVIDREMRPLKREIVMYRGLKDLRLWLGKSAANLEPGDWIEDDAFISTSVFERVAGRYAGDAEDSLAVRVKIRRGTRVVWHGASSLTPDEWELLVERGGRIVIGIVDASGRPVKAVGELEL